MINRLNCNEFSVDAYLVEYCEYMKSFYNLHREEYAKRLGGYYASQESRMWEESGDSPETISEELYKTALEKTKEILMMEKEEEWNSLYNIGGGPYSLYEKIESWNRTVDYWDNLISYRKASDNNSLVLPMKDHEAWKDQLRAIECDLREKRNKAIKLNWRPLTLVYGVYGQYDHILYYDAESNLMIEFSPDDNYYHWGGYVYRVGLPTKGERYYDKEKDILFLHCPLNAASIEFEYSEENEKRYRTWRNVSIEFFELRC